jgi:4-hydroxybenzoate polyprenyltransferase
MRGLSKLVAILRTMRVQHWTKNVLVLLPILWTHRIIDYQTTITAARATMAFCFCASSAYVLNDILDRHADRTHTQKSTRPFAAGDLPIKFGVALVPCLLLGGSVCAASLPTKFKLVLGVYVALTFVYSIGIKGVIYADVVLLGCLYTLRIFGGAASVGTQIPLWAWLCSVLLFLSLALVKRYVELDILRQKGLTRVPGRSYRVVDLWHVRGLGLMTGNASACLLMWYAAYFDGLSDQHHCALLVVSIFLLYWINLVWTTARKGEMQEDLVMFVLKDGRSRTAALLCSLVVVVIL